MSKPKEFKTDLDIVADMFNEVADAPLIEFKFKEMLREARMSIVAEDVEDDEDHAGVFMEPTGRAIPAVRIRMRVYGHKRDGDASD